LTRLTLAFLPKPEIPQEVVDGAGNRTVLHYDRLAVTVFLGTRKLRPPRDAWIDTGSYLTTIPQFAWDLPAVRSQIEWLQPPAGQLLPLLVAGGSRYRYRLGRIMMTAIDLLTKRQMSSPVIAKFTEDQLSSHPLERILIGLRHGLLDGRRLVLEPDDGHACLEDR
jgi:hypothetical protein